MAGERPVPLTVLIPTFNEAPNISVAIGSVAAWAQEVVVLDSFSGDETLEIVKRVPGIRIYQHRFESYSRQWNWALDNIPLKTEWLLLMAADERPSPELHAEIEEALGRDGRADVDGYYVRRLNYFLGKPLRYGGMAAAHSLRLWRHRKGRFEDRSVNEHVILNGPTGKLRGYLIHEDRKGLAAWYWRHNRYSTLEAKEAQAKRRPTDEAIGYDAGRRRWLLTHVWPHLPCKPLLYFLYMYGLRGGFLDGAAGYHYARLRSQYIYAIGLKSREFRLTGYFSDPDRMELRGSQDG